MYIMIIFWLLAIFTAIKIIQNKKEDLLFKEHEEAIYENDYLESLLQSDIKSNNKGLKLKILENNKKIKKIIQNAINKGV